MLEWLDAQGIHGMVLDKPHVGVQLLHNMLAPDLHRIIEFQLAAISCDDAVVEPQRRIGHTIPVRRRSRRTEIPGRFDQPEFHELFQSGAERKGLRKSGLHSDLIALSRPQPDCAEDCVVFTELAQPMLLRNGRLHLDSNVAVRCKHRPNDVLGEGLVRIDRGKVSGSATVGETVAAFAARAEPERFERFKPVREAIDAGAVALEGSDWPVSPTPNPWIAVETLVTRKKPGGSTDAPLAPAEAITLKEAIDLYTVNAAKQFGHSDSVGSIKNGLFADLIVLDRNPFKVPISTVHDTKVEMAIINGEIVYQAQ